MEILNLIIDKKKKVYNRNEKVIVVGNAGNSKEISFKREEIGKKVPQDIVVVDPSINSENDYERSTCV